MGNARWIALTLKLGVVVAPLATVVIAIAWYMPSAHPDCATRPSHLKAAPPPGTPKPPGVVSVRVDGDEFWCSNAPPRLNMAQLQADALQREREAAKRSVHQLPQ